MAVTRIDASTATPTRPTPADESTSGESSSSESSEPKASFVIVGAVLIEGDVVGDFVGKAVDKSRERRSVGGDDDSDDEGRKLVRFEGAKLGILLVGGLVDTLMSNELGLTETLLS